jgi:hypothetical protein
MFLLLVFIFLVVIGLACFVVLNQQRNTPSDTRKPTLEYAKKALLTANEQEFFHRLRTALPDHLIFPQVALGAILQPHASLKSDRSATMRSRSQFAQKIADFLICDTSLNIIAIVELDDRTHETAKDDKRDQAGYYTIRWTSKQKPTHAEIRMAVERISS